MNTGNRILWSVLGLMLLAAGIGGVLASLDRLPWLDADAPLLSSDLVSAWRRWGVWAPILSTAIGLALALLGFALVRAQTRPAGGPSLPELAVSEVAGRGRAAGGHEPAAAVAGTTLVASRTLARALSKDLMRNRSVDSASAHLSGTADDPRLRLHLSLLPGADLGRMHEYVDAALERFNATSGLRSRVADVDVRIVNEPMSRVR